MSTFLAFLYAAVLSGVPLLYGTLGEIITEKAGHLNLGVEGTMYMGAAFAFMGGQHPGSPCGRAATAIGAGVLGALIYAFLTITLKANQNVSGLALTTFGTGVANFLGTSLQKSSVSVVVVPASVVNVFKPLDMGFLSDLPVVGQLIFSHSLFTYLAVALAISMHLYLNKTHCGLNPARHRRKPRRCGRCRRKRNAVCMCTAGWRHSAAWAARISRLLPAPATGSRTAYPARAGSPWRWLSLYPGSPPRRCGARSSLARCASFAPAPASVISPSADAAFCITCVVLVLSSIRMRRENQAPAACGVNYFREER